MLIHFIKYQGGYKPSKKQINDKRFSLVLSLAHTE